MPLPFRPAYGAHGRAVDVAGFPAATGKRRMKAALTDRLKIATHVLIRPWATLYNGLRGLTVVVRVWYYRGFCRGETPDQ